MVLLFYIVVNIGLVLVLFKFQRKNIHALELFFYWCLSTLVVQNYSAIQSMNFKSSVVSDVLHLALAHLANRTVLYPVLTLMFLNQWAASQTTGRKLFIMGAYTAWFIGMESLSDALGVFVHVYWRIGWSVVFWFLYLLLFTGIMKMFRKKLTAEGVYAP